MVVLVGVLKFDSGGVRLDLGDIEEHFVDFLVGVNMWAAEVVGLSNSLFHLQAVHNSKCNISDIHWLYFGVHSFNLPVHAVEHFHLHAPLGSNSWVLMQQINYVSWANNSNIWENCFHFLFTDPLRSETT